MKVVVTGAGGFVGRALLPLLAPEHDIVAIDTRLNAGAGIEGDLRDPMVLQKAFADGCDALIHLATIPGGGAEQDPDLAWSINVDATMALINAAAKAGRRPRVIFASSIAVLGDDLPARVDDHTPAAPRLLYGAHKAMMEVWIDTLTRRGAIDGVSLRLPGIVARPRAPSGMKSAFMSDVFHAMMAGKSMDVPVSPDATMWLISVQQVAWNLALALSAPCHGRLNLPALRVSMAQLVGALAAQTGHDPGLVAYQPEEAIEMSFGRPPLLSTAAADALGFRHDGTVAALVESTCRWAALNRE